MVNPISDLKIFNILICDEIHSFQELQNCVGKVVKYTNDSGKTWHYFLVNECVNLHSPNDQNQIDGVICSAEKKDWKNHLISASVFFTKDAFQNKEGKPKAYFKRVSYDEFKHRSFAGVPGDGRLTKEAESILGAIQPHPYVLAPLILVRSEKPTELKISVLFNKIHSPKNPIVPSPTSVDKSGKYTWNVISQTDGSMISQDQKGILKRIGMIWWESLRKTNWPKIDPKQAICVKKSELKTFLSQSLQKMGVQEKESAAFTHYWDEVMSHEADVKKDAYVLVQPIQAQRIGEYLPQLEVKNNGDAKFNVNRFYFLFKTASDTTQGMSPDSYLKNLQNNDLGKNVVLDLGGEIIDRSPNGKYDSQSFIHEFIQKYIYQNSIRP